MARRSRQHGRRCVVSREFDRQAFLEDRGALECWEDIERNGASDPGRDSNPLADLLVFLSDGFHTGTLLARALAFLWVLRPDLVQGEGGAASVDAVAGKAGLSRLQLYSAVRQLRTTAPELDQVMRNVCTSRARFLALAEIKARRRKLDMADKEAMAEARLALAHERVKEGRKRSRDYAQRNRRTIEEKRLAKRLRVARQMLALADPLFKKAAEDFRAFDRSMGLVK